MLVRATLVRHEHMHNRRLIEATNEAFMLCSETSLNGRNHRPTVSHSLILFKSLAPGAMLYANSSSATTVVELFANIRSLL